MKDRKALVIEDDPNLSELVSLHLSDLGFEVSATASGKEGFRKANSEPFNLVILDLMLPDGDGIDICRQIRMERNEVPIIMLTARTEEIDKVLGLESGADDYITKPFSIREFIARVKAVLRREEKSGLSGQPASAVLEFDNLRIDQEKRLVEVHGNRTELTPKEFDLLLLLASHPGRSFSRDQLLDMVWGYQFEGYDHTVNSHINRLRAKVEADPSKPEFILTSWGIGYRFNDQLDA